MLEWKKKMAEQDSAINVEADVVPSCGVQVEFFVGCAKTTNRSRLFTVERKRSNVYHLYPQLLHSNCDVAVLLKSPNA